jgi:hypothetical protein
MQGFISPQARKEQSLYIEIMFDLGFHANWKDANGNKMFSAPEEVLLSYIEIARQQPIYKIHFQEDNTIRTACYELLDNFKPELDSSYTHADELPKWVQDKLAVLMLLDHKANNQEVAGVGRRINEDIFWVFKGEQDGDDPRGES